MKDDRHDKQQPMRRETWFLSDRLAKRRHAGWMSAALSAIRRLGANIGQTSWWLLLVLASPMVEGASLLHPTGDVQTTLAQGAIEGRATISGRWAKLHIMGDVAGAAYHQMSSPVVMGISTVNTPGQSKSFYGFACTKYKLQKEEQYSYECFALINLKKGMLVDAVFSDAEPEDDETEDRLTAWWDAQGNKGQRVPDIHEIVKDQNSQEWIFVEEINEENEELEGFDYIRGKIDGQAVVKQGWIDFNITGDAAEALYYQMPSSIKDDAKCLNGQTKLFHGFMCTKYQVYNTERYDYECVISINFKKNLIDDHNLSCPNKRGSNIP
jgi:hypothetical protein